MLKENQKRIDHRLFERLSASFPLSFKGCGGGSENDIALCDVSAQGIGINANKYLVRNESVEFEVDLKDGFPNMTLEGAVVWSRANMQKGWHVGVKLNRIHFMRMSRLYRALHLSTPEEV